MKKLICFAMAFYLILGLTQALFAYVVPEQDSRIKYFYVFGPQGDIYLGAEKEHKLSFYFDVPENEPQDLTVSIFDPDTGGRLDYRAKYEEPWNTVTEFAIYGRDNQLLDKNRFAEASYDRKLFQFGPYLKTQGEKIGDVYRFKLEVRGIEGTQGNLFNIMVLPDSVETFSYKFTFRLLEREGEKMYLYPEIPAGTTEVVAENYDLDINGGSSELYDPRTNQRFDINDSESGVWAKTAIPTSVEQITRFKYVITKKTQNRANAGVQFKDNWRNPLPIYFKAGKGAVITPATLEVSTGDCRQFIFDGTESYDPDNQKLSYHWDFGDGTTSTEPIVTHKYDKGGQYTVVLSVTDNSGLECDTDTTEQVLIVNSPPQVAFLAPEVVCHNQEIIFDASPTQDNTPEQLSYHWDFGDGTTAEGKEVTKLYKRGGVYRVTLTVDDNSGTACSIGRMVKSIAVNESPVMGTYADIDMCIPLKEEYQVAFNFTESGHSRANVKCMWDFGDGSTAEGKSVTHIYKTGGEYTANLRVDDGLVLPCSTGQASFKVKLSKRPVAEAGSDILACLGTDTIFDASGSAGEEGSDLIYNWDFGDGSTNAQGVRVKHTYKKPGTYKASLTVSDAMNKQCVSSADAVSVLVNDKTSISLKDVNKACVGEKIDFNAILNTSSDSLKKNFKYTWDFTDGTVKEAGANISHTYLKGGQYLVKVTVDDQLGTPCSTDTKEIKVTVNTPPVADAGPNLVCCVNKKSVFDASSSYDPDGDKLTYAWDFGDGTTAKGVKVTHVYKKLGKYTVVLSVDDNSGTACSSATDSFEAVVQEQPVSVIKVREGKK